MAKNQLQGRIGRLSRLALVSACLSACGQDGVDSSIVFEDISDIQQREFCEEITDGLGLEEPVERTCDGNTLTFGPFTAEECGMRQISSGCTVGEVRACFDDFKEDLCKGADGLSTQSPACQRLERDCAN